MKFNETIKKLSEELIRPDKEIFYRISNDFKYVWVVVMKEDHFLIEVDGPPIKQPKDSLLKKTINFTKQTALNLVKAVKKRLVEEVNNEDTEVLATLKIPFDPTNYSDVVNSKQFAKDIIQGSKDLYDIKGKISLEIKDIEKYITG